MNDYLNLGSLLFGLIAWILPIINLMRYQKRGNRNWIALSMMSFSACSLSLCLQIAELNQRVQIGDWTGLMDTTSTLVVVAAILLVVTIVLNAVTLIVYRAKTVE